MKKLQKQNNKLFNVILKSTLLLTLVFTGVKCSIDCPAIAVSPPLAAASAPAQAQPQPSASAQNVQTPIPPALKDSGFKKTETINFKTAFLKFFLAMLGVVASALIIFLGLKLYKKFTTNTGNSPGITDFEQSLERPKDFKEAINLFLHKSDK